MQIERKTMKIKREDIDNMSHISVIAAIALPENLEEAARSIPDEVIKQGMVMEHCLYYSQVQNQHLDLENIVITDQHRYEGLAEALSDQIMAPYNIRMGNPSASEEQVIAAAKAAQCHEFISKLPDGYHTVVGSKGIHLSGGERQRIAIARAIIKDAPIIVLDEATAFSDPENEYLIQKAFEKLMQDKTVIIIAHRLSTIRNADKIIVVEKGHLIEEGNHDELVATGGRYAQMWNHYTEAIGWKISGKVV